MTKTQRARLKGRDLAVWSAAYAAEMVRDLAETRSIDEAMERTSAEAALHIADFAVEEMRRWEKENGS